MNKIAIVELVMINKKNKDKKNKKLNKNKKVLKNNLKILKLTNNLISNLMRKIIRNKSKYNLIMSKHNNNYHK